jgi:hypothetical protein
MLIDAASCLHVKVGVLMRISSTVLANARSCMHVTLDVLMWIARGILCYLLTIVNVHVNVEGRRSVVD